MILETELAQGCDDVVGTEAVQLRQQILIDRHAVFGRETREAVADVRLEGLRGRKECSSSQWRGNLFPGHPIERLRLRGTNRQLQRLPRSTAQAHSAQRSKQPAI